MGSSSVLLGLVSCGVGVVAGLAGVVGEVEEGSMTMRRSVGWRACRDIVACFVVVGWYRSEKRAEQVEHRAGGFELVGIDVVLDVDLECSLTLFSGARL